MRSFPNLSDLYSFRTQRRPSFFFVGERSTRRTVPIGSREGSKRRSKWKETCGSSSRYGIFWLYVISKGRNRVLIHAHIYQFQCPARIAVHRQRLHFKENSEVLLNRMDGRI